MEKFNLLDFELPDLNFEDPDLNNLVELSKKTLGNKFKFQAQAQTKSNEIVLLFEYLGTSSNHNRICNFVSNKVNRVESPIFKNLNKIHYKTVNENPFKFTATIYFKDLI